MQQLRQQLLRDGRFAGLDVARTVIRDDFREDVVRLLGGGPLTRRRGGVGAGF